MLHGLPAIEKPLVALGSPLLILSDIVCLWFCCLGELARARQTVKEIRSEERNAGKKVQGNDRKRRRPEAKRQKAKMNREKNYVWLGTTELRNAKNHILI